MKIKLLLNRNIENLLKLFTGRLSTLYLWTFENITLIVLVFLIFFLHFIRNRETKKKIKVIKKREKVIRSFIVGLRKKIVIDSFPGTGLFQCPLKTSENLWFSDVFRLS